MMTVIGTKYLTTLCLLSIVVLAGHTEAAKKTVIALDEESWTQLLEGEWMVDFYAPWCPACKKLDPEWKKFAEWSDDLNIKVASIDVTQNPGISGRFMISGLPTIYHVKNGVFRQYTGSRQQTSFINFIEDKGWEKLEPMSRWRAPNTLQMSFIAYSFRISLALRDVHNYLVDEIGLPYYISYLIFALCVVALGTLLGLVIVFVIDQFYPPRPPTLSKNSKSSQKTNEKKKQKPADQTTSETSEPDSDANADKRLRRRAKGKGD